MNNKFLLSIIVITAQMSEIMASDPAKNALARAVGADKAKLITEVDMTGTEMLRSGHVSYDMYGVLTQAEGKTGITVMYIGNDGIFNCLNFDTKTHTRSYVRHETDAAHPLKLYKDIRPSDQTILDAKLAETLAHIQTVSATHPGAARTDFAK